MFVDVVMLLIAQKLAEQPRVMDPRLFARALRGMRKGSSGCEHIELSHWPEVFRYMLESGCESTVLVDSSWFTDTESWGRDNGE